MGKASTVLLVACTRTFGIKMVLKCGTFPEQPFLQTSKPKNRTHRFGGQQLRSGPRALVIWVHIFTITPWSWTRLFVATGRGLHILAQDVLELVHKPLLTPQTSSVGVPLYFSRHWPHLTTCLRCKMEGELHRGLPMTRLRVIVIHHIHLSPRSFCFALF